jgi:hypothetical protein
MYCSGIHLGITINIKNTKFVKDLPMIDAQFRFNQCNSFREEYNHWKVLYKLCVFYVDRNSKMNTTAVHSFYIGPIGSFYNQVNDTGS